MAAVGEHELSGDHGAEAPLGQHVGGHHPTQDTDLSMSGSMLARSILGSMVAPSIFCSKLVLPVLSTFGVAFNLCRIPRSSIPDTMVTPSSLHTMVAPTILATATTSTGVKHFHLISIL